MRIEGSLRKLYGRCRSWCHRRRFEALMATCAALVRVRRATIGALGRAVASSALPKHSIKRVDRLIGNSRLAAEHKCWYREIARRIVGKARRVVVAVDWTEVGDGLWSLAATTTGPGRGVVVYQQTWRHVRGGDRFYRRFLSHLVDVLPASCDPVVIADAGFRKPFFRACRCVGLDFVVRLRAPATIGFRPDRIRYEDLLRKASARAQCLGETDVYGSNCRGHVVRVVLGAKTRRAHSDTDGYYERRALEPWLLATSITDLPAAEIVRIYALRMHIEETFRDTKSGRLGLGVEYAATRTCRRMNNLLLVAALAHLAVVLIGLAAEHSGSARHFQANTTRARRVLSVFRLGVAVLTAPLARPPSWTSSAPRAATVDEPCTPYHERYGGVPPHDLYCPDCGEHFEQYGWPPL